MSCFRMTVGALVSHHENENDFLLNAGFLQNVYFNERMFGKREKKDGDEG